MNKVSFVWLCVAMVLYFFGTYVSKLYSISPSNFFFFTSLITFMFVTMCWMPAIEASKQLAVFGAIWSISCFLIQVFIGIVLFREDISITKYIGIGMGAISIILLSL